jgi:hypothetical protein
MAGALCVGILNSLSEQGAPGLRQAMMARREHAWR